MKKSIVMLLVILGAVVLMGVLSSHTVLADEAYPPPEDGSSSIWVPTFPTATPDAPYPPPYIEVTAQITKPAPQPIKMIARPEFITKDYDLRQFGIK